jgi:hypothetical protein
MMSFKKTSMAVLSTVMFLVSALFFFSDAILADDYKKDGEIIITRVTPETAKKVAVGGEYQHTHYTNLHSGTCDVDFFEFALGEDVTFHNGPELQVWVQVSEDPPYPSSFRPTTMILNADQVRVPSGAVVVVEQINSPSTVSCKKLDYASKRDKEYPNIEFLATMTPEIAKRIADEKGYECSPLSVGEAGICKSFKLTLREGIDVDGTKAFVQLSPSGRLMSLAYSKSVYVPKGATIQFHQLPSDLK